MTALVGQAALVLGAVAGLLLIVAAIREARRPAGPRRLVLAVPVTALSVAAIVAMGALIVALLTDDFSVSYVAEQSARATPTLFKVATAWASLEGSLVLWTLVLAAFTYAVYRKVDGDDRLGAGALAVMGVVALFFFALIVTVGNPFTIVADAPLDGPGPNPLLQNHALMAVHPPIIYVGLVGWAVPFAFAIAALALGRAGPAWLERTRRWSLISWAALTAGVLLGGWWSYEVLGWGGYWAWDPVENASLLPWLTATAFIHSAVAQSRRGVFKAWNLALIIVTFALTIFATFLTRSGVVASVHSFTQSHIGPLLLAFFVTVLVGGFGLFAARAHRIAPVSRIESLASREGAFLVNNFLLALFTVVVLVGTTYPIFVEAASGAQMSVGRPYFDRMTLPIAVALLVAMGVGPLLPYRVARGEVVRERVRVPVLVGLAAGAGLVLAGVRHVWVVVVVTIAVAVIAAMVRQLVVAAAALPGDRPGRVAAVVSRNRGFWGGQLAHLGVALVAVAIAVSGGLDERMTTSLTTGERVAFAGYEVTYEGTSEVEEAHRTVTTITLAVERRGRDLGVLEPSVNDYHGQPQAVGTPAVRTGLTEDLYAALRDLDGDRIAVELIRFPFIWLLWVGGLTIAAGAVWSVTDRRSPRRRDDEPAVAAEPPPDPSADQLADDATVEVIAGE